MPALLSTVTVAAVGLTCKAVFATRLCSVQVTGLGTLLNALEHTNGRGVVTVSNHISTLDDPLTWGILPARCFFSSRTTRWALGASDVVFTNPVFSTFFHLGQTIETFRGQGVYQKAVDSAIHKLDNGGWVHLFGEGKIYQPNAYPKDSQGLSHLPRFKWGVGRILMESSHKLPMVIPMWLTGYERLMPEGRPFPYKYIPRFGTKLGVAIGDPIPPEQLLAAMSSNPHDTDASRSQVTALVHDHVEALGRRASANPSLLT
ncbi:hypothetical protein D9611_002264 [Ephemerocybe angulata]|uniref:Uncharacterized protein n=2 Tax=Ephemerocybe angulata TaxID=980116 RepID=A0A8H5C3L5_9AGAR|nr:hypothetical protein D9611_002264 [Tulosesus angulatus]KAF6762812.1 acyltransferase-domain-containing protein [Tulosesus angulatus]